MNLGVVDCASSLCHGSITPWKGSNVLQNEYVTWSRVDKHALRASQVLWNDRSKRIAANLGLRQPAHEAKICVDCHGYNPPPQYRGERFKASDGMSCEACHGPAEHWIKSHVAPGATHAENVRNGLYPTDDPVALARLCLSCHFGNKDKFVTHRMMGAGHPRISFELDTFTQTQPPHFVVDEDWQRRKGRWDGVRVWAIGQALAAQEQLDVVLDPKRGRDGLFPELVVFDCHACHHPMSETRWKPRVGTRPGTIRFNDSNLLMLRQIVRRTFPAESAAFNDLVLQLHKAVAGEGGDAHEAAARLRKGLEAVVAKLRARDFDDRDLRGHPRRPRGRRHRRAVRRLCRRRAGLDGDRERARLPREARRLRRRARGQSPRSTASSRPSATTRSTGPSASSRRSRRLKSIVAR